MFSKLNITLVKYYAIKYVKPIIAHANPAEPPEGADMVVPPALI